MQAQIDESDTVIIFKYVLKNVDAFITKIFRNRFLGISRFIWILT